MAGSEPPQMGPRSRRAPPPPAVRLPRWRPAARRMSMPPCPVHVPPSIRGSGPRPNPPNVNGCCCAWPISSRQPPPNWPGWNPWMLAGRWPIAMNSTFRTPLAPSAGMPKPSTRSSARSHPPVPARSGSSSASPSASSGRSCPGIFRQPCSPGKWPRPWLQGTRWWSNPLNWPPYPPCGLPNWPPRRASPMGCSTWHRASGTLPGRPWACTRTSI